MKPQQPHELFVSERPVRSDFARHDPGRDRVYARRRIATIIVLLLIVGGAVYGIWGRGARNPADIPVIKAEGGYKQKPADPGGIDIPHQDVQVYDALDKAPATPPVEHLLPPPEVPQPVQVTPSITVMPPPDAAPPLAASDAPVALTPPPADILPAPAPRPVATTVTPEPAAPVAPPPAPKAAEPVKKIEPIPAKTLSIDDVLKNTESSAPKAAAASGNVAAQLASSTDEARATSMMHELQQKYAAQLGGAHLRIARADLGPRGIFYRIQTEGLGEDSANRVCSALKQIKAGCILVRK
ncbi:MAG: SPOR domain-containing protein [Alphaproteobacteria bacterium]|nr:SPOR domain-containing protein [Alphaproteobacteria bacterium]